MKKQQQAAITANNSGISPQYTSKSHSSVSPTLNHQKCAHAHTAAGSNTSAPTPTGEKRERKEEEDIAEW